jgi:hypothetical protein
VLKEKRGITAGGDDYVTWSCIICDQIKEGEMGGHVAQVGDIRNLYKFLVRKVDGRSLEKCALKRVEDVGWNNLYQDGVQ